MDNSLLPSDPDRILWDSDPRRFVDHKTWEQHRREEEEIAAYGYRLLEEEREQRELEERTTYVALEHRQPIDSTITRAQFEELVQEALDSVPNELWESVDNLAITVEEWPTKKQLETAEIPPGETILGLYEGIPLSSRGKHYGLLPSDKITIFRGPILRKCPPGDVTVVRAEVRRTVLHHLANHFGIDNDRLKEIGAY